MEWLRVKKKHRGNSKRRKVRMWRRKSMGRSGEKNFWDDDRGWIIKGLTSQFGRFYLIHWVNTEPKQSFSVRDGYWWSSALEIVLSITCWLNRKQWKQALGYLKETSRRKLLRGTYIMIVSREWTAFHGLQVGFSGRQSDWVFLIYEIASMSMALAGFIQ